MAKIEGGRNIVGGGSVTQLSKYVRVKPLAPISSLLQMINSITFCFLHFSNIFWAKQRGVVHGWGVRVGAWRAVVYGGAIDFGPLNAGSV